MKKATVISLLASLLTSAHGDSTTDVTATDFDAYLSSNNRVLVSFTSKSLKAALPFNAIFSAASNETSTPFVSVDCDQELGLCKEHDVNAYPTVRLFETSEGEDVKTTRYRGPRTKTALQAFVKKHELPTLSNVQQRDLEFFKKIDDIVVMAYLDPDQPALLEAFTTAAQRYHLTYPFGYSTELSSISTQGLSTPSIVCYRNTDGDNRLFTGPFTPTDIDAFLSTATQPVIRIFRERDVEVFMQRGKLTVYIFTSAESAATTARYELTPLAKKYDKYVIFAIVDVNRYKDMAENFGINVKSKVEGGGGSASPALVVHAPMNDNVFVYHQGKQIQAHIVEDMLSTILKGKAVTGQVFGAEAENWDEGGVAAGHDEL